MIVNVGSAARRILTLVIVTICLSSPGLAQLVAVAPGRDIMRKSTAHGLAALESLADEDIDKALEELAAAADLTYPANNRYVDGLSAACGGLFRQLHLLDSDEQYDLLHNWSMPTDDRKSVRVLTSLVPETAPPSEFARALGERPKKDSFTIASVGKMSGLFCTAWTMVAAADDAGSLRELISELEPLATDDVPNAKFVLMLAKLQDSRSDDDELNRSLSNLLAKQDSLPAPIERSVAVLLAAAMPRKTVGPLLEEVAEEYNSMESASEPSAFVAFLRRLRAHVILNNRAPESVPRELFYTTPALWVSADGQFRSGRATGADEAIWLTHEDHVKRLAGPGDDTLLLRYPLTGTFELKGEVAELEHGGGGLTYGGMTFDANSKAFTLREVQRPYSESRVWPFVAPKEHRMFNRVNVRADGQKVTFLSNLHPGWKGTMESAASCPWLGLRAFGNGRIIFRNLELVGDPTIPREVQLIGQDLRGWTSTFGEATPRIVTPFPTVEATPEIEEPVWVLADGEIQGKASATPDADKVAQSHLAYMRPCLDSETVSYEFYYEADKVIAHPVIGRVAFLMEPGGLRLHWLTGGAREWTGLPADNAIIEPLNRRGSGAPPLKDKSWNSVSLTLSGKNVMIKLNGEEIYQRPLEDIGGRHFGIYHDKNQTTARVRNVVLTGDWPQKLSAEQLGDLVAFESE